ncbi:HAD superfamily hydrolase [Methanonatronarchaeum thermophilum]|uniref:Phosphoglycolate phosphatase n=1 Tax=Methanonatronarchaeum thermophilum TaxID=1927129 RepID=A0A1Y3GCR5_9EURY|nr:phosphoglycolate phosphatase [Methanonatronarchaeum thermophilum]OUJ19251.1 HAD superfamily hydrolase [Methanonatronarchaeum thermophilum]
MNQPSGRIKAVAIDIDGTITDNQRRLSLSATKAIRRAIKNDIKIILATGNATCFARSTAILLGTNCPVIAENGGVINHGINDNQILADNKKVIEAFKHLKTKTEINEFKDHRYTEKAFAPTIAPNKVRKIIKDYDVEVIHTKFAIHIKNKNINKATALQKLTNQLNIPLEQTIAIGDSNNDIEMIEKAGTGIALGNSTKKLKQKADIKINKQNGQGVTTALKKLKII